MGLLGRVLNVSNQSVITSAGGNKVRGGAGPAPGLPRRSRHGVRVGFVQISAVARVHVHGQSNE